MLSHFAYPRFSDGRWLWVQDYDLGSDAVVVFFVLSGLVISHATQIKQSSAGAYVFDRTTRLLSVAVPALLIGAILDRFGSQIAPHLYSSWIYNPLPVWELLLRGVTFSNEWGGVATRLGTNGPYWSLSYEAAYYALFGIAMFTTGLRRMSMLAIAAWIFGINILLLLPVWLMGIATHKAIASDLNLSRAISLVFAVLPVGAYIIALAMNIPFHLKSPVAQFDASLRFSNDFIWNSLLAVLVSVHLIGMAHLLRRTAQIRCQTRIRWLANGSFSLYVLYYPVLQFMAASGMASRDRTGDVALLGWTLAACYVFAEVSERRLPGLRKALLSLVTRFRLGTACGLRDKDDTEQSLVAKLLKSQFGSG
ncbi:MAG: hypothetical protein MK107_13595 [Oceanicola sp.]|nr:hypothetical protein [Oceanicola sp.]